MQSVSECSCVDLVPLFVADSLCLDCHQSILLDMCQMAKRNKAIFNVLE